MRELTLYPTKQNLQKGIAFGVGATVLAVYLYSLGAEIEFQIFAIVSFGGGLWMIAKSALRLANPKPIFEADQDGFSVKGKAKRPWSEFRGVSVYRAQSGLFTVGKFVRVKVGKSFLGGNVQIGMTEMSASAERMVSQIDAFADAMKAGGFSPEPYHVPPVGTPVEPVTARPVTARPGTTRPATTRPVTAAPQQASFAARPPDSARAKPT